MKAKQKTQIVDAKTFFALLLIAIAVGFAVLNEVSLRAQVAAEDTFKLQM